MSLSWLPNTMVSAPLPPPFQKGNQIFWTDLGGWKKGDNVPSFSDWKELWFSPYIDLYVPDPLVNIDHPISTGYKFLVILYDFPVTVLSTWLLCAPLLQIIHLPQSSLLWLLSNNDLAKESPVVLPARCLCSMMLLPDSFPLLLLLHGRSEGGHKARKTHNFSKWWSCSHPLSYCWIGC